MRCIVGRVVVERGKKCGTRNAMHSGGRGNHVINVIRRET